MNPILQAFVNQVILFAITAVLHVCYYYQGKAESLNPFNSKVDLLLFLLAWFGLGTYLTWKFNWGVFAI